MLSDPAALETSIYQRYRDEMNRVAAKLEVAATLGGVMRGRLPRKVRMRHRCRDFALRIQAAGGSVLSPETDDDVVNAQRRFVVENADEIYVSPRLVDPAAPNIETGHWLAKRAWQMRMCGRSAVGVGLLRQPGELSAEKVYHATCKDRLCPACNAKMAAHGAGGLKRLMREQFNDGRRLLFVTLTVRHRMTDSLQATRAVLDKAWALLIRRKWFKDTFDERLRCAEIEFTNDNGWHPHFHLLLRLREGCKAGWWPHDKVQAELKRLWRICTAKAGRESWHVDLRELVVHGRCADSEEVLTVRYWLRPEERRRYELLERRGKVKLLRRGPSMYRIQTIDDVVDELTKYVTKRSADGVKPNQRPFHEWTADLVHEYAIGIRYWNLRRASKGWEQQLIEASEEEQLARELEADEAGGYEYFPWARIIAECKAAAKHELDREASDRFAADYPRILKALDGQGCDVSADMIKGYIFRFFGEVDVPLKRLIAKPWEIRAHREEQLCERLTRAQVRFKARHYRVLLRLRRQHDRGVLGVRLSGLNMSRKRLDECIEELRGEGLLQVYSDDDVHPRLRMITQAARYELTDDGRRMMTSSVHDPAKKHADRKAIRHVQRLLPGMILMGAGDG